MIIVNQNKDEFVNFENIMCVNITDCQEDGKMLYGILDRVSCWCCANKNKKELENMRLYLPDYYLKYIALLKQIKKNNKKRSNS